MISTVQEPNTKRARILVVDDDRAMCQLLIDLLREDGYDADVAYDGESALEKCRIGRFDLAITDLMMPRMKGIELVQRLREMDSGALVLLITAFGTIENAVEAMRRGAYHYVNKPFNLDEIRLTIGKALERKRLQDVNFALRRQLRQERSLDAFIGASPKMLDIFETIRKIADSPSNVVIAGDPGAGYVVRRIRVRRMSRRLTIPSSVCPSTTGRCRMFARFIFRMADW